MTTRTEPIQPVDGWCYAVDGHFAPATFWDIANERGKTGCTIDARRELQPEEFARGRAVAVRLIEREE
jgi:hypothetical protein